MKKLIALSLAAIMLLAVGCSTGGTGTTEPQSGSAATSGTETTTGGGSDSRELVVGLVKTNTNLDPYGAYGDEQYGMFQAYDTLVHRADDGSLEASAAESYTI